MDILLISGPLTDPTIVPLSVPALAAHLRSEGFTVDAWDLSIDCVDMVTSPPFLLDAITRIDRRRADGSGPATENLLRAEALARTLAPVVIDRIEDAKATFRDTARFYDYRQYKNALWTFQAVWPILHAAYFPTVFDKLCYDPGNEPTVEHILAHLTDPDGNLFLAYFESDVVPRIARMNPPLVALSISWDSQLLPTLTLCRLLRERLPDMPIILGGGYVTAMQDRLETEKFLWDFATAVVFHDGESALAEICRRVKDGRNLRHIPNVFFKDDPIRSSPRHTEDMRTLSTPDFTGLPLDRYFFPEPVLAVQSSRGCYWNKCTFCASANMTRHSYRQRPVEQLVQDMAAINAATGATVFFICDLATPPHYLKRLGEHIHTRELLFHWTTETRFDAGLDEAACRAIATGGCLNLSFGFESASDRVLGLMQKGTTLSNAMSSLEACKKAALSVTLFAFMGFPGETVGEAQVTRDFFLHHTDLYTSCTLVWFKATLGCEVVEHPERYNVSIIEHSPELFVPMYDIEVHQGISTRDAQALLEKTQTSLLLQTHKLSMIWGGAGAPHDLLYLRRYGRQWRDTLDTTPNLIDTELNTTAYTVDANVMYRKIDKSAHVIYKPTGSFAVVPTAVVHAMQLLESRAQSIPAVAQQTVRTDSLDSQAHYRAFYELILHLLHLAKAEFLVQHT